MWKEFREFAARGNVLDLAVGVIIGAAFGKIVTSLVNDVVMPPIGLLLGRLRLQEPVRRAERRSPTPRSPRRRRPTRRRSTTACS